MSADRCPVCGRASKDCHLENITILDSSEAHMLGKHRSRERVYAKDDHGIDFLLYPVGARIPDEEAVRQGIIAKVGDDVPDEEANDPETDTTEADMGAETAKVEQTDVEDKAIRPGASMPAKKPRSSGKPTASTK